jgi:hypothetical protein
MRSALVLTIALSAGVAFGQGLGVTPALPDGASALAVTPQAGPWMILVASFVGETARGQAEELATEIRGRYNLPAYVFNRTAEERRAEQQRVARIKEEMKQRMAQDGLPADTRINVKTVRIKDEYGVLVGGYKDDAVARKELDRIRKLKPSDKFNRLEYVPDQKTGKVREQAVSPFQSAFICHNPSVPVKKAEDDGLLGARLEKYNANESYSLLKCGKPYTLVIRAYKNAATMQSQSESGSFLGMGHKPANLLNACEHEAHKVAEVLRTKPKSKDGREVGVSFEAYALHTEFNSYVCIGAFDSPDDPRMQQTMQLFLHEMHRVGSAVYQLNMQIHFLDEPMPMPVPKVN